MPTTRTSQNIDAVNFKEQSVDPAAPGAGYGLLYREADGWHERLATAAESLLMAGAFPCDGRLTLTTLTPIITADTAAAGTLYFTPYMGNRVALYDGTRWRLYAFTELSLALTATSGKNYDVFLYDNAGTLTLELSAAWTTDTARADALVLQDGAYVKSGATTRRWLGTIRASGANQVSMVLNPASGTTVKIGVWNAYNQVAVTAKVIDTTDSWTYATLATWRAWNASAFNRFELVCGAVTPASCVFICSTYGSGATVGQSIGIGIDSTTVLSGVNGLAYGNSANYATPMAAYDGFILLGYHFVSLLEACFGAITATFIGDQNQPTLTRCGGVLQFFC